MRLRLFVGFAALGLLWCGASGCGTDDPVAANAKNVTIAPTATQGPEELAKAQAEREKAQADLDKKARRK
jgi:hypothetical protein